MYTKLSRFIRCAYCGATQTIKLTCGDCAHSFSNPFDQRFCEKGNKGTRLCKQFKKRKEI